MDKAIIYAKMRELEVKIRYHFNDIAWLSKAMRSEKIEIDGEGKNHSEYTNDGLATVGDAMLKSVIASECDSVPSLNFRQFIRYFAIQFFRVFSTLYLAKVVFLFRKSFSQSV